VNGGMQHFGGFDSKQDARDFYYRARVLGREQRLNPGQPIPTDYTVPELFSAYLPQAEHRRAFREQQRFADWWSTYWPKQRVFGLTPAMLETARIALRKSGRFGRRSERTVTHYLQCLKHAMRAMIQPRSWVVDLWSQVQLDPGESAPPVPLTLTDETRLIKMLSPEDLVKVRLALLTGLRRAQLFQARWEQVLWEQAGLSLPTIKRQRSRFLPLVEEAIGMLKRRWGAAGRPKHGPIFPDADDPSLPEDANAWYKNRYKPALKRAGLDGKGLKFHSTRHAFALRFLDAGGHVRALQKAGGWSSLSQVEIYTQMQDESVRAPMESAARLTTNCRKLQMGNRRRGRRATK